MARKRKFQAEADVVRWRNSQEPTGRSHRARVFGALGAQSRRRALTATIRTREGMKGYHTDSVALLSGHRQTSITVDYTICA